jgi:hypothetical protein
MIDNTIVKDRYFDHQSKAGKKGGRSRSLAKRMAARANLAMVRARRHNPVTGPQPINSHVQQIPPAEG